MMAAQMRREGDEGRNAQTVGATTGLIDHKVSPLLSLSLSRPDWIPPERPNYSMSCTSIITPTGPRVAPSHTDTTAERYESDAEQGGRELTRHSSFPNYLIPDAYILPALSPHACGLLDSI